MMSNEDFDKIKNNIMQDLHRGQSKMNEVEEDVVTNNNEDDCCSDDEAEDQEENINFTGLPVSGLIFYPYQDKSNTLMRYDNEEEY